MNENLFSVEGAAEGLLAAVFNGTDLHAGVFELLEADYRYLSVNRNAAGFYDLEPADLVGKTGADLGLPPEQIETRMLVLRRCWDERRTLTREYPFAHRGRRGWFLGTFVPIPGPVPRVGFLLIDITKRKEAELAAEAERRRLKLALDATQLGLWEYDIRTDRVTWDARTRALFAVEEGVEIDFACYAARLHPEDAPAVHQAYERALQGENDGAYVVEHRTVHGRWIRGSGQVIFDNAGAAKKVLGTTLDITTEVQAREQERLLLAELNHRVKNNLATVQSIAVQTARNARDLPAFVEVFEGRLVALARTHDVLTARSWSDADLMGLVRRELESFAPQVTCQGPDVALDAKEALALGLIVHELATNAAKYGALARADGLVCVSWERRGEEVVFRWREQGGPPASAPRETGFGSRLISRLATGDLRGCSASDYTPQGLRFRLSFRPSLAADAEAGEDRGISAG